MTYLNPFTSRGGKKTHAKSNGVEAVEVGNEPYDFGCEQNILQNECGDIEAGRKYLGEGFVFGWVKRGIHPP